MAAGAFADNFQISLTSASGPWTTIDAAISHGNLPIGSSVNDASTGTTVSNPSTIYVKYCADSNNQITELDESNNCRVGSFAVTNPAGPSITSCAVSPNPANIGQTATWTATISGGTTPFTYEWSGSDSLSQINSNVSGSSNSVTKSYSTAGSKNTSVRVSDTNGNITPWYTCNTLTVSAATPSTPTVNLDIRKLNTGSWANSVSIVAGEEVELQWSASNATRCVGDSYFSTGSATSGNQQTVSEPASGSRTYTVTCYNGPSGSDPSSSDSVTVDVTGAIPSGPPEISAAPTTVDMGGKTSIMWTLNGHTGCSVNGANGDTVGGNPKTTDRTSSALNSAEIYGQTKYTILCSDDGSSDQVTINVRPVFEEI